MGTSWFEDMIKLKIKFDIKIFFNQFLDRTMGWEGEHVENHWIGWCYRAETSEKNITYYQL